MRSCSVTQKLKIVPGNPDNYRQFAHYHYRDNTLGPFAAIFAIRPAKALGAPSGITVGVIVYTMPTPTSELRNIATNNFLAGFDKETQLALINKNIRCISRVIIEPRFRGLGLASRLVRETLGKMNVPIIEAMAVMGLVNPFFEKAGMSAYRAKVPARCIRLGEAFSIVGIEKEDLVDSQQVQQRLKQLKTDEAKFIELEIRSFLQSYGKRRRMPPGQERTKYILNKLTTRPVYYIWFNPKLDILTG